VTVPESLAASALVVVATVNEALVVATFGWVTSSPPAVALVATVTVPSPSEVPLLESDKPSTTSTSFPFASSTVTLVGAVAAPARLSPDAACAIVKSVAAMLVLSSVVPPGKVRTSLSPATRAVVGENVVTVLDAAMPVPTTEPLGV
jgi:hypothetical protein